jgi:hypothetical protein
MNSSDSPRKRSAPGEEPVDAPKQFHTSALPALSRKERKGLPIQVKKVTLAVISGVIIFLVSGLILALASFFYGDAREAKILLATEKERRLDLERDVAELKKSLQTVGSELAATNALLSTEKEKRQSLENKNADYLKRISKLTEAMALVQQNLAAPSATLDKAKRVWDQKRKQGRDFKTGMSIGELFSGDDFSGLADLFNAPDQLRASMELTAAAVEAYESRIQASQGIIRSALAAEISLTR